MHRISRPGWHLGVRAMSATSFIPSSSDLANANSNPPSIQVPVDIGEAAKIALTANPTTIHANLSRPVSGVIGHCFIRFCLWVDLVTSWKRRTYVAPQGGFPNIAAAEIAASKTAAGGAPVALSN